MLPGTWDMGELETYVRHYAHRLSAGSPQFTTKSPFMANSNPHNTRISAAETNMGRTTAMVKLLIIEDEVIGSFTVSHRGSKLKAV
jgi:hypothetical protein